MSFFQILKLASHSQIYVFFSNWHPIFKSMTRLKAGNRSESYIYKKSLSINVSFIFYIWCIMYIHSFHFIYRFACIIFEIKILILFVENWKLKATTWWYSIYSTLCDQVCHWLVEVGGFLCVLRFPPPIKLTATI
jgi:hypothetical protein